MKILTEDNQEISIQELTADELDTPTLEKDLEQELKDVTLDLGENNIEEVSLDEGVTESDINASEFDTNLFDDFDNLDE